MRPVLGRVDGSRESRWARARARGSGPPGQREWVKTARSPEVRCVPRDAEAWWSSGCLLPSVHGPGARGVIGRAGPAPRRAGAGDERGATKSAAGTKGVGVVPVRCREEAPFGACVAVLGSVLRMPESGRDRMTERADDSVLR